MTLNQVGENKNVLGESKELSLGIDGDQDTSNITIENLVDMPIGKSVLLTSSKIEVKNASTKLLFPGEGKNKNSSEKDTSIKLEGFKLVIK